jgi:hypothetical protein
LQKRADDQKLTGWDAQCCKLSFATFESSMADETLKHEFDTSLGIFICNPAHIMPQLDIVRKDRTPNQVIVFFLALGKAIRKVLVVLGLCREAGRLLVYHGC